MTKYSIAAACTLTLALASSSFAGTAAPAKEAKVIQEVVKESCITGDIGLGVVSEYVSRGVVNENQGFIAQPYLDLYFKLYEGEGFINKVSLNLGLWSSLHSEKTFASPGTALPAWYEFDWMPGMTVTFAKNFALSITWLDFDFVSSGGRAGNLLGNLSYDDTDLLGAFALKPHIAVMKTFIGNGVGVPGGNQGWYYEAGIAPGFTVGKGGTYPVSFVFPINVGLGHETYNEDFGYASAGINASVPLAFVPECYGSWTLSTGFTYLRQGDNAAEASAPALTSGEENNRYIFSGSIGLTF